MATETFNHPLPLNIEEKDAALFHRSDKFTLIEPELLPLKNVFVFSGGQVFRKGRIFPESLPTDAFIKRYSSKFFLLCLLKCTVKSNWIILDNSPHLIVHDEFSANYFHWLTDSLARIHSAQDVLKEFTLIVPESLHFSYHSFVLKKMGVRKIKRIHEKQILFAPQLILPVHTSRESNFHPALLKSAVEKLMTNLPLLLNMGERIYISRQKSATRKILNEEEVIMLLKSYDFTILNMEDYSFEEQISIHSHACVLVSIHGAGLTNLIFMPPQSTILEFRKAGGPEIYNCYFNLAAVFGHRYFYQGCESDSEESVQSSDIFVNLDKLQENLRRMLEDGI